MEKEKQISYFTNVGTGPKCREIPFYGTKRFAQNEDPNLKDCIERTSLYKQRNIYFVLEVEYEWGSSGAFLLMVEHFEDGMLTMFTYGISPENGKKLAQNFPGTDALREAFGHENGGDIFLKYCTDRGYAVDYTEYWL